MCDSQVDRESGVARVKSVRMAGPTMARPVLVPQCVECVSACGDALLEPRQDVRPFAFRSEA